MSRARARISRAAATKRLDRSDCDIAPWLRGSTAIRLSLSRWSCACVPHGTVEHRVILGADEKSAIDIGSRAGHFIFGRTVLSRLKRLQAVTFVLCSCSGSSKCGGNGYNSDAAPGE